MGGEVQSWIHKALAKGGGLGEGSSLWKDPLLTTAPIYIHYATPGRDCLVVPGPGCGPDLYTLRYSRAREQQENPSREYRRVNKMSPY